MRIMFDPPHYTVMESVGSFEVIQSLEIKIFYAECKICEKTLTPNSYLLITIDRKGGDLKHGC